MDLILSKGSYAQQQVGRFPNVLAQDHDGDQEHLVQDQKQTLDLEEQGGGRFPNTLSVGKPEVEALAHLPT